MCIAALNKPIRAPKNSQGCLVNNCVLHDGVTRIPYARPERHKFPQFFYISLYFHQVFMHPTTVKFIFLCFVKTQVQRNKKKRKIDI